MVLVDIRETKSVKAADIFLQVRPGKDFELITILRAMIKDQPISEAQIAETGLTLDQLQDFVSPDEGGQIRCDVFWDGTLDDTWETHELGCLAHFSCRDERVHKIRGDADARPRQRDWG